MPGEIVDSPLSAAMTEFVAWLRRSGCIGLENIDWSETLNSDGVLIRSCIAARSISPQSEIASIPSSLVLTEHRAAISPPGRAVVLFLESNEHLNNPISLQSRRRILLLPWLVYERFVRPAGESPFWAYLNILPLEFQDPLWWTVEERIRELNGTNVFAYAESRDVLLRNDWETARSVCGTVFERDDGTDLLTWSSDAAPYTMPFEQLPVFDLADPARDSSCGMALLPGLDMLDHGAGVEIQWRTTGGSRSEDRPEDVPRVYFISGSRSITEGSTLLNNYGPKGNEELLMGYGFIVPESPDDYVRVRMSVRGGSSEDSAVPEGSKLTRRLQILHLLDPPRSEDGTTLPDGAATENANAEAELLDSTFHAVRPTFLHHLRSKDPLPRSLLVQATVFTATTCELSLLELIAQQRDPKKVDWDPVSERVTARNMLAAIALVYRLVSGKYNTLRKVDDSAGKWWASQSETDANSRRWVGELGRGLRQGVSFVILWLKSNSVIRAFLTSDVQGQMAILHTSLTKCTSLARLMVASDLSHLITLLTALSDPVFAKPLKRVAQMGKEVDETETLSAYLTSTPELRERVRDYRSEMGLDIQLNEEDENAARESWNEVWTTAFVTGRKKRKRKAEEPDHPSDPVTKGTAPTEDDFVSAWAVVLNGLEVEAQWWEQVRSGSDLWSEHQDERTGGDYETGDSTLVLVL
ncbi:hypothetical protein HDU93_009474 [Gonapodya sp. JEL0774]|nr:hypothetical protein HDU93_009474 [Gonapodya sp. JEL0774]